MNVWDTIVALLYLAAVLLLGGWMALRHRGAAEFHLGGRTLRWFPIGLSVAATLFSAINFTAFSGEVAHYGLYVVMALPAFPLVALPVVRWVIPFYCRQTSASAYAFLEQRFDGRVRQLASALFILWRLAWVSIVLYATSRFMAGVTGLSFPLLLLLSGGLAIVYTAAGGLHAVVWTDVLQFAALFGGLTLSVAVATSAAGGWRALFSLAAAEGALEPFHPLNPAIFSADPRMRISLWSALIGTFVAFLTRYGADQMVIQRYMAARSRRHAQTGFVLNIVLAVLAIACLGFIGLLARVQAAGSELGPAGPALGMARLSLFIRALPAGVRGLLVAGLFASTMSSVDSGLHSCVTALTTDFPKAVRWHPAAATALVGIPAVLAAAFAGHLGTVFELANKVVNGLGAPLLAVVAAGWLHRHMTPRGVWLGGLAGAAGSGIVSLGVENLALHYYAVVNTLGTLALCKLFSIIDRPSS